MKRAIARATALTATLALALPATGFAAIPKVGVFDDYYSPTKLEVKKNTKVKFKWDDENLNPHNVVMKNGPKGVKKSKKPCAKGDVTKCNRSAAGSIGIKFAPTFNKKGKYSFICTIHPTTMNVKIEVK